MNEHLNSFDAELNQSHIYRVFALGCFDAFITLPITITNLVLNIERTRPLFNFYQGWAYIHSDWEPVLVPKSVWSATNMFVFTVHWDEWINPFFALVFFALFGLTPEARKGYRRFFRFLRRPFNVTQGDKTEEGLPEVVFRNGRGTNATATSNISNRYD